MKKKSITCRQYTPAPAKMTRMCSICKATFEPTETKKYVDRHIHYCKKKWLVTENDKKFGVIRDENFFKCVHCIKDEAIVIKYASKLREHVFRHVLTLHAGQIPKDVVKINLKNRPSNKKSGSKCNAK